MEEIELKLKNDTPFCELSNRFPALRIFRWCSSVIDYVEAYGSHDDLEDATEVLAEIADSLDSEIIHRDLGKNRLSAAIACRCSVKNSTIRVAETNDLLWEAPAFYSEGFEKIKLIAFGSDSLNNFVNEVSGSGEVRLEKRIQIRPESLRDLYTISLSDVLGELTEKQLLYMQDAIRMGLFSTPRRNKIEDLAGMHGVTKSTMQEHVNKARNKLIIAMEPYLNLFLSKQKRA